MALLDVHGLTRAPWFRDFALEVAPGEIVVLRGASGSGKTLLLRTIADLDPAEGGTVRLAGVARESMPAPVWRSRVLYLHPDGARLPGTVRETLRTVAGLALRRPQSLGADVGNVALDAPAEHLSSGESHAIALARAVACAPDVLLLDEPTASMDPERARAWEARLVAWVGSERAIVWITHEDGLAARVGAREVAFP